MKIQNVILDMGNVLLKYDPDYSLNRLCKNEEAKPIIKKEFFQGSEWIQTDLGVITPEERYEFVKRRIPEEYRADFKAVSDNWDICMTPLDNAREFCEWLRQRGFKVFVLSNASEEFYRYFPRHFDLDFFDGIVVSCNLNLIKPDLRIYEHLLGKYSLLPEECLFVDDVKDNTDAAEKVGMKALCFKGDYEKVKALLFDAE